MKFTTIKSNKGITEQLPEQLIIFIERNNALTDFYYKNLKAYKDASENKDLLQRRFLSYADESYSFYKSDEYKMMRDNVRIYAERAEKSKGYADMAKQLLSSNFDMIESFISGYNSIAQNKIELSLDNNICEYVLVEV